MLYKKIIFESLCICDGKFAENVPTRNDIYLVEKRKYDSIYSINLISHKSLLHGGLISNVEQNGRNDYSALGNAAGHLNGPNDS